MDSMIYQFSENRFVNTFPAIPVSSITVVRAGLVNSVTAKNAEMPKQVSPILRKNTGVGFQY